MLQVLSSAWALLLGIGLLMLGNGLQERNNLFFGVEDRRYDGNQWLFHITIVVKVHQK